MRIVTWTIRLVLFVLLVAFAAKNVQPVTLRFYFDVALEAPLILALAGRLVRQRRQISSLRRESSGAEPLPPPVPPL